MSLFCRVALSSVICLFFVFSLASCGSSRLVDSPSQHETGTKNEWVVEQPGDASMRGGKAHVRKAFVRQKDVPGTTNDESNDQPLGHFGTRTITALYLNSGNEYPLDADIDGNEVKRLYFEKGGWVDFSESEIDSAGNGSGTDEQGRQWEFHGFTGSSASGIGDEEAQVSDE